MKMRKSRLSKEKQERLMEHFVSGSTARCASEVVNVNKNTASYFFHRLREVIYQATEGEAPFSGEIEVDESYFQHMLSALRYATVFLLLFFVAIIHAVFPFIFRKTSSIAIQEMVKHIESREVV